MSDLLTALVGRSASLLPFQAETAGQLASGHNVLLRAPTGSGKTWAVLLPFVWSFVHGRPIADRLIYALPLRALATSLFTSTSEAIARARANWGSTDASGRWPEVTIQTGEQPDDPLFQKGDIIFCTIDQLLSSYLNMPLSLPARLGNINVGALIGALVVFDEVHLLEPHRALATSIDLANRLRDYTQLAFATATLSSAAADLLASPRLLDAERVDVTVADIAEIPNLARKRRLLRIASEPLTPAAVLAHHCDRPRTLAICNTVPRAQELYRGLRDALAEQRRGTKLLLLHSQFISQDRKERESALAPLLGKGSAAGDIIVVSTQAVEAGMDISADVLHTEACPANSLVQRFGRCARFASEGRGEGQCYVYALPLGRTGQPSYRPYGSLDNIEDDLKALLCWDGKNLGCEDEQRYVDAALSDREKTEVAGIDPRDHSTKVLSAITHGNPANVQELVRSIDAVNIIVRGRPEELDATKFPLGVSLSRRSLFRLNEFFPSPAQPPREGAPGAGAPVQSVGDEWVAKVPAVTDEDDEAEHDGRLVWRVATPDDLGIEPFVVCLNPRFAAYDPDLGLLLGTPGGETPVQYYERPERGAYTRRCESWEDHARGTAAAGRDIMARHGTGRDRCERALGLHAGFLDNLLGYASVWHDTGKLSRLWQAVARELQEQADPTDPMLTGRGFLAHTSFDRDRAGHSGVRSRRLPPHAMEGAFLAAVALDALARQGRWTDEVTSLAQVVVASVIAHHHAPRNSRVRPFVLVPGAAQAIPAALREEMLETPEGDVFSPPTDSQVVGFPDELLQPARHKKLLPVYWLLVRVVRLADQQASGAGDGKTGHDQEP